VISTSILCLKTPISDPQIARKVPKKACFGSPKTAFFPLFGCPFSPLGPFFHPLPQNLTPPHPSCPDPRSETPSWIPGSRCQIASVTVWTLFS
jgi:hypothetical protein